MNFNLKDKWIRYSYVWAKARKPSKEEFTGTTKVCLLGLTVIGVVGFAIFMGFRLAAIFGGLPL